MRFQLPLVWVIQRRKQMMRRLWLQRMLWNPWNLAMRRHLQCPLWRFQRLPRLPHHMNPLLMLLLLLKWWQQLHRSRQHGAHPALDRCQLQAQFCNCTPRRSPCVAPQYDEISCVQCCSEQNELRQAALQQVMPQMRVCWQLHADCLCCCSGTQAKSVEDDRITAEATHDVIEIGLLDTWVTVIRNAIDDNDKLLAFFKVRLSRLDIAMGLHVND